MEKDSSLPKTVLPFIWRFLRPRWKGLTCLLICPLIWAFVSAVNPFILKLVIDSIVSFQGDRSGVWIAARFPIILYISLQIFVDLAMRIEEWLRLRIIPVVKAEMRAKMFDYVQNHSHRYFQEHLSGTLSNKVLDMVRSFENMFICFLFVFLPITVSAFISVILLWTVHYWFGLFVLIWFVIYLIITGVFSIRCIAVSDMHSEANSKLSGKLVDAFKNISTIRLFSRMRYENSYLSRYQKREVDRAQILGKELLKVHIFQGIASTLFFSFSLVLFVYSWQQAWVTVGDFTFVMTTTFSLMILTWWMAEQFVIFFKELGVSRQALTMINVPHEIKDAPNALSLVVKEGKIEFDAVTFFYVQGKNIFRDKNLVIHPGAKIGLVGFSGSGKTTFANLILRFFDVQKGKILIDNQDISKVTQHSLRENIAMIPQDTMLFHRTLMENIRYGRIDASDAEVIKASKKACCHDFISELDEGYDALVGESGIKLSGGQRQRIAIARAILKEAPILILDEATSALDSATEKKIQKSLYHLMENRTTIVIAHRLSTLSHLDRILVFHEGAMIESGTHEELLDRRGHYAHLWKLQLDGFLPDKEL
ncbi:MAG: ABC transporter ATP-binding protein [Waddliaceae bacterium]